MSSKRDPRNFLERLVERDFPIAEIYKVLNEDRYYAPIARLILRSAEIADQAKRPWLFKSLATWGTEQFILTGDASWAHESWRKERSWAEEAERSLSYDVLRLTLYEESEGLIFYERDGDGYRPATRENRAYDLMFRMREEGHLDGLRFVQPPTWAEELFIGYYNYEAFAYFWYDCSTLSDPRYQASKEARARAVALETQRLMGEQPLTDVQPNDASAPDGNLLTRERTTLLTIIAALCAGLELDVKRTSKSATSIEALTERLGARVAARTIEEHLKKIDEALQRRGRPG